MHKTLLIGAAFAGLAMSSAKADLTWTIDELVNNSTESLIIDGTFTTDNAGLFKAGHFTVIDSTFGGTVTFDTSDDDTAVFFVSNSGFTLVDTDTFGVTQAFCNLHPGGFPPTAGCETKLALDYNPLVHGASSHITDFTFSDSVTNNVTYSAPWYNPVTHATGPRFVTETVPIPISGSIGFLMVGVLVLAVAKRYV